MKTKKVPMRQCIGCRESKEKKDLIRIVKTAENQIVVDKSGRQNGRGAYMCDSIDCLKKAEKSCAIEKSFKMSVDKEIYKELERQLMKSE